MAPPYLLVVAALEVHSYNLLCFCAALLFNNGILSSKFSLLRHRMARLLMGPRARAHYPRRQHPFTDEAPYHIPRSRHNSNQPSLFSRQSLMILSLGILFGYLLLPVLLVQKLDFNELPASSTFSKPPTTAFGEMTATPFRIKPSNKNTAHVRSDIKSEDITSPKMNSRNLTPTKDRSKVEQRLVEEANILAQQSLPTNLSPKIMKTPFLPDHQRKKILVTGGAGFVGSHLVDKLMMEGHEVTVVDNFFTGQKKNIAHWLHHPNFR